MRSTNNNSSEETVKASQSKSNKKSTKSRSKSSSNNAATKSAAGGPSGNNNSNSGNMSNVTSVTTPTTPTMMNIANMFDTPTTTMGNNSDTNSNSRSHHKSYAGLEPRSIKIIWEQHDQSDVELSPDVCARVAEDASYKLWELINNIKVYARHSGGTVTYDLVNEVLRDADVAPALGAMDSDWDRIDYDGSFFFYSDKIIELREEYQNDVTMSMPHGADFVCSLPVEDKNAELLKKYIPNLIYVAMYCEKKYQKQALEEAISSPIIGSCYRVILDKLIQILAFKQSDTISSRCWQLLRACAANPHTRYIDCREEYFHLAEILICQLLAPYESIKHNKLGQDMNEQSIKMEIDDNVKQEQMEMKNEYMEQHDAFQTASTPTNEAQEEKIFKLELDDDDEDVKDRINVQALPQISPYFASPVDLKYVGELCETIGQIAALNGYFQSECLFHITRRLERFFEDRNVNTEKEYIYISRAVQCLICLGEYAFREFIPFAYKFNANDVPESIWNDFALGAVFLNGPDDIYLYEWLACLCGVDKLQPFMVYYAQYFEKLLTNRHLRRKRGTFKINPKVGVRRLEWSTLAAAMCHGDDPDKAIKPKPTLSELFPKLVTPNLKLNRAGTIRFKFAGCRPVIIKPKTTSAQMKAKIEATTNPTTASGSALGHNDILIAKRWLYKPLTNERRIVPLSSYYYVRI